MLHFANKGVPVLPVHDSFIIAAQHQQELVAVMKRVFGECFDGADIKVTVKCVRSQHRINTKGTSSP